MIKLENVTDLRTGKFHSVAWVSLKNVKYFENSEAQVNEIMEKVQAYEILVGEAE